MTCTPCCTAPICSHVKHTFLRGEQFWPDTLPDSVNDARASNETSQLSVTEPSLLLSRGLCLQYITKQLSNKYTGKAVVTAIITLRAKLGGTVHCYTSSLWRAGSMFVGLLPR